MNKSCNLLDFGCLVSEVLVSLVHQAKILPHFGGCAEPPDLLHLLLLLVRYKVLLPILAP